MVTPEANKPLHAHSAGHLSKVLHKSQKISDQMGHKILDKLSLTQDDKAYGIHLLKYSYGAPSEKHNAYQSLKSYHKFRVQRVTNGDPINLPVKEMKDRFIGVDGVSFLTAH